MCITVLKHLLVALNGANGVINGTRMRGLLILLHHLALKFLIDGDLGDLRSYNIHNKKSTGLLGAGRPANGTLTTDRDRPCGSGRIEESRIGTRCQCVVQDSGSRGQRECCGSNGWVCDEQSILSRDEGHTERLHHTLRYLISELSENSGNPLTNPPAVAVKAVKFFDNDPSAATSHCAMNPGVGGTPFTLTKSFFPSSENRISLTVPGGPVAGVVWFSPSGRTVFPIGVRPRSLST